MLGPGNPWVSQPAAAATVAEPTESVHVPVTGPSAPQRGVTSQDGALPKFRTSQPSGLFWVGTHGGAGASTLAGLLSGSRDAALHWPLLDPPAPSRVVLVARTNDRGIEAARGAAVQWASGTVPTVDLLGLVFVADAPGRLPRDLAARVQVAGGGVPRTWSLPWVEGWRRAPASIDTAPRELIQMLTEIVGLLSQT